MSKGNKALTPEQRAARIKRYVQLGGFIALGLVAAPIIAMAVYGILGIILAAVVLTLAVTFAPWFAMKCANWKLKSIKAEARESPVETLQNEYLRRSTLLEEQKIKVEQFCGQVKTFESKMEVFSQKYPREVPKFQDMLGKMQQLLQVRKDSWRRANLSVNQFADEIQKAQAIWEMSVVASDTADSAGMTDDDFFAKIKTETSIDTITENMNSAFAQLETSLMVDDARAEMENRSIIETPVIALRHEAEAEAVPMQFRPTLKQTAAK